MMTITSVRMLICLFSYGVGPVYRRLNKKAKSMSASDIWIFGYGSLVWRPGFNSDHQEIARLNNYARSFCMWSVHYRGTHENKGLVLALDHQEGVYCDGVAFRVNAADAEDVLAYLRERELVSAAYLEIHCDIELKSGEIVKAYTYVIDPDHSQYAAGLSLDEQAAIIARGHGTGGPNTEYLFNVATHLKDWGIADPELDRLSDMTRAFMQD
jgi:cation transport protein ChaC